MGEKAWRLDRVVKRDGEIIMKKIYKGMLLFFSGIVAKIDVMKTFFAEWHAILRKKGLYKNIKWSVEQQREFDEYWIKNYGKKISSRWHKLYEAITGVHRVDYFPEIIYSVKYEPLVNNREYSKVFSDKTLNDLFFDNKIENVRTPKYFIFNNHGKFYDSKRNLISKEKAIEILSNIGEAVIKPTVDSSSGKNVAIIDMQNAIDVRTGYTAETIILNYKSNFIVQEKILPCEELKTLYPLSINTIRIISYILEDSVEVAPISLRIGGGGSEVDNIHAGGMSIAVNDDGLLSKCAYRLGYGDSFENYFNHPDTGIKFEGYKLSFIPKLIDIAKQLHGMTANIGIISWDFTVDKDNNIVVVEANYRGQSVWFPQMLSGRAFFGDNTYKILQFLNKKLGGKRI